MVAVVALATALSEARVSAIALQALVFGRGSAERVTSSHTAAIVIILGT